VACRSLLYYQLSNGQHVATPALNQKIAKLSCFSIFFPSSHWWSYRQLELTHSEKNLKKNGGKAKVCAHKSARSHEHRSAPRGLYISWSISPGQQPRPHGALERNTYAKLIDFRFGSVQFGWVCGMQFLRLLA